MFTTFGCVKQIGNFDVENDASTASSSIATKMQLIGGGLDLEIDSGYYFVQVNTIEKSALIDVNSRIESGKIKFAEKISDNRFILAADAPKFNSEDYVSFIYRTKEKKVVIVLPRIVVSLKLGSSIENILQKYSDILRIEKSGKVKYILKCGYKILKRS